MKIRTARRIKRRSHLMKTAPVAADPALPEETAIAAAEAARDAPAAPVGAGMPFRRPGGGAGGEGGDAKAPGGGGGAPGRLRLQRSSGTALAGQGKNEEGKSRRHGMVIRDEPCD
jgi:hypothetical protein